jgi:hypothetical protein
MKEFSFDGFYETSARDGVNTNEIFMNAAKVLYLEYKRIESSNYKSTESSATSNSFKLKNIKETAESGKQTDKDSSCAC